jgi:hypothetical protein
VLGANCVTEAKSDLVNVLSRLEGHWVVLEAELVEINKDIAYCETCVQKYGYASLFFAAVYSIAFSYLSRMAAESISHILFSI